MVPSACFRSPQCGEEEREREATAASNSFRERGFLPVCTVRGTHFSANACLNVAPNVCLAGTHLPTWED